MGISLTCLGGNSLRERYFEVLSALKSRLGLRNTFGDRVIITDEVLVWQGDKLLFKARGHIVNQGLIGLCGHLAASGYASVNAALMQGWGTAGFGTIRMGIGDGVTVGTMTTLINENTTQANTHTGAATTIQAGTYRIAYIVVWNAGTIPAITVREMGLKFRINLSMPTTVPWACPNGTDGQLYSRLSSADGDFTAFTINTAVPLTVEWRITLTFA